MKLLIVFNCPVFAYKIVLHVLTLLPRIVDCTRTGLFLQLEIVVVIVAAAWYCFFLFAIGFWFIFMLYSPILRYSPLCSIFIRVLWLRSWCYRYDWFKFDYCRFSLSHHFSWRCWCSSLWVKSAWKRAQQLSETLTPHSHSGNKKKKQR